MGRLVEVTAGPAPRPRVPEIAALACARCGTAVRCLARDVVDFRGVYWPLCAACATMVADLLHRTGEDGT